MEFYKKAEVIYSKYAFTILMIVLSFVLLFPKLPLLPVVGTFVAVRIEDILIAIVFGLWFIFNLPHLKSLLLKNITQSFLLFWGVGLLSLFTAIFLTASVSPHLGILHYLRRVEVMGLFFVAASSLRSKEQLKKFLIVFFVINLFIVLYGFGQLYLGFKVISTTNSEFSKGQILELTPGARPNSTFAGHYDLAIYLSIVLVFFGVLFFYYKKYYQKALILFGAGISFLMLGFTAARVSFVATLIALGLAFLLMGKRLVILLLFVAALFVIGINPELRHRLWATVTVNFLGGGGPKYNPPANEVTLFTPENKTTSASLEAKIREATGAATASAKKSATISADIAPGEPVNSTELGVYRSYNIRADVEWPRAMRAFYKNPILGSGYSSISLATDNDYLRSLGEVGLLGSLSLSLIFFVLLKRFILSFKAQTGFERLFIIGGVCIIGVVLITATFIDVLEASKVATFFWVLLGLVWAISDKKIVKDNE